VDLIYMLMAIIAGIFTTLEASINSQLGKQLSPSVATLHSLFVGMTFILLINLVNGKLMLYSRVTTIKPIWLIGGLFGASIIYLSSRAIPKLGISNTIILILSGQMLSGLLIDALVNHEEISVKKVAGLILFLAGEIIFLQE